MLTCIEGDAEHVGPENVKFRTKETEIAGAENVEP